MARRSPVNVRADELKTNGLKATVPRLKVLGVFHQSQHRHLSADDVYRVLLEENADISLGTVYLKAAPQGP
ncbi:hypothetical protein G8A07_13745 [Roseateles sp. DAIF2]|nr:hypothetical protein G8A07_13745 [Roseateles sp. DAIF2]